MITSILEEIDNVSQQAANKPITNSLSQLLVHEKLCFGNNVLGNVCKKFWVQRILNITRINY